MEFHLGKMQIAGSAILFHYLFTAVAIFFLPSSSFSHSIIATSGNYKFYLSQTAMDSFFYRIISSPLSIAAVAIFFLPSSSFSHSIIATLWQLQVLFITNCNGQFFFTALSLRRGPLQLGRFLHIQGFRRVPGVL